MPAVVFLTVLTMYGGDLRAFGVCASAPEGHGSQPASQPARARSHLQIYLFFTELFMTTTRRDGADNNLFLVERA